MLVERFQNSLLKNIGKFPAHFQPFLPPSYATTGSDDIKIS